MRAFSAASGSLPLSASTAAWIDLLLGLERSGQRLLAGLESRGLARRAAGAVLQAVQSR